MGLDRLERKDLGIRCLEFGVASHVPVDLDRRLAHFYSAHLTEAGGMTLGESRGGSFSRLLRLRSDRALILRAESEEIIKGVASVSVRPGYIGGQEKWIAYLGDLRIEFERDLLREWRRIYGDLLQALTEWPEAGGVAACLTSVVRSNERAVRALVEPHRLSPYRYRPLADFRVVNVLGSAPLGNLHRRRFKPKLGYQIRRARAEDQARIIEFLDAQHRRRLFGDVFSVELPRRLRTWPNFTLDRFLIVEDRQGRIRATAAPWSPGDVKRWLAEKLPPRLIWMQRTLARLPRTRWLRPPVISREGEPVDILFLTHLELDFSCSREQREEWLAEILHESIRQHGDENWNAIAFVDFNSDSLAGALGGFYYHAIEASLFSVHGIDGDGRVLAPLTEGEYPPAFELVIS
ncbi:MAG: hypothetical protein NDI61_14745 [Bdellovibrionaceae bacterium]|nr:hypothetical protein [Pseudobdellovibrionaceae bacterium]